MFRSIRNGADTEEGDPVYIADVGDGCGFHINRERRGFFADFRSFFIFDKLLAGHHCAKKDWAGQGSGIFPYGSIKRRICMESIFHKPRMKFRQDIVCHVMVDHPVADDGIKELYPFVDPAGSSGVDDDVRVERIDQDLGGNSRIYFADAAVYGDNVCFTALHFPGSEGMSSVRSRLHIRSGCRLIRQPGGREQ